jgi:hypothetical protein
MLEKAITSAELQNEAMGALEDIGHQYDIDLISILKEHDDEDVADALRAALYPAIVRQMEGAAPGEDPEAHTSVIAALKSAQDTGATIFPDISWEQSDVPNIETKTGSDVAEFVSGILSTLRLTQGSGATPATIAATILGTGLSGLGPVAYYAWKSTAKGFSARIVAGISEIGVAAWGGLAATVIVEIAIFLLTKQASFVGLVVNNSSSALSVKKWRKGATDKDHDGLYLNHGKMSGFMVADLKKLHSDDETQIGGSITLETEGAPTPLVYMGLFYAEKRKAALFGTEGAMIFEPKNGGSAPKLALAWTCPYSGSNGAAVAFTNDDHSAEHWWKKLKDKLALSSSDSSGSYSVSAAVNSSSGPNAACIVVIDQG